VGSITQWEEWIDAIPVPDLILAGSPCQGFSVAGTKQAFDDKSSSLFFTFADILKHVRKKNQNVKFLLENVQMHSVYVNIISYILEVRPVVINSVLVSAQERKRFYWCNWHVTQPEDKHIMLQDVLEKERKWQALKPWMMKESRNKGVLRYQELRKVDAEKAFCLTGSKTHPQNHYLSCDSKQTTYLSVTEAEKLQTLPVGYCSMLSELEAFDVIGNAWTVDVVAHILKGVNNGI
jgi:DNA (cytosine-5)-methyltransferase 3A